MSSAQIAWAYIVIFIVGLAALVSCANALSIMAPPVRLQYAFTRIRAFSDLRGRCVMVRFALT
jgi:hypothetical protein